MEIESQVSQFYIPPGFIDLGLGDPQSSLLPLDIFRKAGMECFDQDDPGFLQYGFEKGLGIFRRSLADFLARGYSFPVDPECLFITNGASMGLHLICDLFTRPGDTVFVEEPTYFLALRIFADRDLHLVPIQTDKDGLLIESLEEKLSETRPKFLYLIPTYQNPTGQTLSPERRIRLLTLSRQHEFLVVADEVYHFLKYSGPSPRPFAADSGAGNVISLSSFSKILAPGLRLGWIQSSQSILERFTNCGLLDSGGGMNPFTSAIVSRVVENGSLNENIAQLITTFRQRIASMDAALRRILPGTEYALPQGGYFFWIRLPNRIKAADLQKHAANFKVGFRSGSLFSSEGGMEEFLRLSFVYYGSDDIERGVLRIKQCLDSIED